MGPNGGKAFRRGSAIPDGWIGQGTIPRQEDSHPYPRPVRMEATLQWLRSP